MNSMTGFDHVVLLSTPHSMLRTKESSQSPGEGTVYEIRCGTQPRVDGCLIVEQTEFAGSCNNGRAFKDSFESGCYHGATIFDSVDPCKRGRGYALPRYCATPLSAWLFPEPADLRGRRPRARHVVDFTVHGTLLDKDQCPCGRRRPHLPEGEPIPLPFRRNDYKTP